MLLRNTIIVLGFLVLVGASYFVVTSRTVTLEPKSCTLEAMICADGSAVGRSGPNCEFAACPSPPTNKKVTGIVKGQVTLFPTCPVERIPPDPACAPKPYSGVLNFSSKVFNAHIAIDANGNFLTSVPVGDYKVNVLTEGVFPRCEEKIITVIANSTVNLNISCDTGIR